jgi:hypothetical protein
MEQDTVISLHTTTTCSRWTTFALPGSLTKTKSFTQHTFRFVRSINTISTSCLVEAEPTAKETPTALREVPTRVLEPRTPVSNRHLTVVLACHCWCFCLVGQNQCVVSLVPSFLTPTGILAPTTNRLEHQRFLLLFQ